MTARFLSLVSAAFLLAACNSGDNLLEWDEETAAMLAAQEAAPARMIYGPDVPQSGLGATEFDALWAARETMAGT